MEEHTLPPVLLCGNLSNLWKNSVRQILGQIGHGRVGDQL